MKPRVSATELLADGKRLIQGDFWHYYKEFAKGRIDPYRHDLENKDLNQETIFEHAKKQGIVFGMKLAMKLVDDFIKELEKEASQGTLNK